MVVHISLPSPVGKDAGYPIHICTNFHQVRNPGFHLDIPEEKEQHRPMSEHKVFIGVYSPASALQYGTVFYEDMDGKEVEVTGVYGSATQAETNYKWDDKQIFADRPLVKWLREGKAGISEL